MTDKWISMSILTDSDGIYSDGEKILDLLEQDTFEGGADILVDEETQPELFSRLGGGQADERLDDILLSFAVTEEQLSTYQVKFEIGNWDYSQGSSTFSEKDGIPSFQINEEGVLAMTSEDYVTTLSTFETYFYTDGVGTGEVFAFGGESTSYSLQLTEGTLVWYYGGVPVGGVLVEGENSSPMITGEWVHLCLQKEGGIYRTYLNGSLVIEDNSGDKGFNGDNFYFGDTDSNVVFYIHGTQILSNGIRYDWNGFTPRIAPYRLYETVPTIPNITPPSGSPLSYKIISDLTTKVIGDTVASSETKYYLNGEAVYDQLLADGSEVDFYKHPKYWSTVIEDTSFVDTSSSVPTSPRGIAVTTDGYIWVTNPNTIPSQDVLFKLDNEGLLLESHTISQEDIDAFSDIQTGDSFLGVSSVNGTVYALKSSYDNLSLPPYIVKFASGMTVDSVFTVISDYLSVEDDGYLCTSASDMTYDYDTGYFFVLMKYVDVDSNTASGVIKITPKGVKISETIISTNRSLTGINYIGSGKFNINNGTLMYTAGYTFQSAFTSPSETLPVSSYTTTMYGGGYVATAYTGGLQFEFGNKKYTPVLDSGSTSLPYRVLADLT